MNNAETLQQHNTRLNENNSSLNNILETINNLPNSSGGNIDLSNYATKEELPTKTSQLENDSNFITEIPEEYAKKTDIPSIEGLATEKYVDNAIANIDIPEVDLTGYATEKYVDDAIANIDIPEGGGSGAVSELGEMRLITQFAITEDAVGIQITQDDNGQPFELSDVDFRVHVVGSSANSSNGSGYIGFDFSNVSSIMRCVSLSNLYKGGAGSTNYKISGHTFVNGGYIETFVEGVNGNLSKSRQEAVDTSRAFTIINKTDSKITGFYFGNGWGGHVLGTGTLITIYGR